MSCLLNDEQRRALRIKVASDFFEQMKSGKTFDIKDYINHMYSSVKSGSNNEALAIDVARLIPTIATQILAAEPELKTYMRMHAVTLGVLDELEVSFENVENVRELLGLKESPAAVLQEVQQQVSQKTEAVVESTEIQYNGYPDGAFRSFGPEVVNYTDPTKPDYLQPKPEEAHNFMVQRALDNALRSQIASKGITNSSEMEYPGVTGGIYMRVIPDNLGYGGLVMVVTDQNGTAIKFDNDAKVVPNGMTTTYKVASDPLTNSAGEIITDKAEFNKVVAEKKLSTKGIGVYAGILNNIQKQIEQRIALKNPTKAKLTAEEEVQARKEAVKDITAQYKLLSQMRQYLHANKGAYITTAINGSSRGFVVHNMWKRAPLSGINFPNGFTPILTTQAQAEGSGIKEGTIYFNYPGVDEVLVANGKNFIEVPKALNTAISLFTEELHTDIAGQLVPMDAAQRSALLDQFLYTSDVKFLANETGGGVKNWLNSDGSYSILVGDEKFKIKFDGSVESKALQARAAEAIKVQLTKPFVKADEKGFPVDKDLNSVTKVNEAVKLGATVVYDIAKAVPGSIYAKQKSVGKNGPEYDYFRVYFPVINANNSLINQKYSSVSFSKVGEKTVLKSEDKSYNDFIKDNFVTSATPSPDGTIRQVNPFMAIAPIPSQLSKFVSTKKENSKVVKEEYKGKIIYATPGSGKSTFAEDADNLVDTDKLLVAEIAKQYPQFLINKNIPIGQNIFPFFIWARAKGIDPLSIDPPVRQQMKELAAEGKTVLTGSVRLMDAADYIFLQQNKDILKNRPEFNPQKEVIPAGKKGIKINTYMDEVLTGETAEKPVVKPVDKTSIAPATQIGSADQSVDDIKEAIKKKNKFLEKSASQKQGQRSTEKQMQEAEEWYSKHPLAVHFPFRTLFNAVNTSQGPAAQWAVHGITLFHYFSADGKLDLSKSGDFTDLYHEAWHGFTQTFLTKEQREKLYGETRKKSGSFKDYKGNMVTFKNATVWQLEEFLAEDFRSFMMSGGKTTKTSPTRNSIFRRILNFLKELFTGANTNDVIKDPLAFGSIHDIYEKLRVGDLSNYNFDVNNRDETIGILNKAMLARNPNEPMQELGHEDANVLVGTVDSMISDVVNEFNKSEGIHSFTSQLMRDKEDVQNVYKIVKKKFVEVLLPGLQVQLAGLEDGYERDQLQENIKLVEYAIQNFGDVDDLANNRDGKGLIAYHQMKSKYIATEDREAFFDDINEAEQLIKAADKFDRSGNETSQLEMASPKVHYLLRSIHKFDEKGQPVLNKLGVQELTDYHEVWNKLARVLGGEMEMPDMYQKMREAAYQNGITIDPVIAELIDKLGPAETNTTAETEMWIKFWSAFNLAEIRLVQMNIEKVKTKAGQEIDSYTVKIGAANTQSRKVGAIWKNAFRTVNSEFIKRNRSEQDEAHYNMNYLDIEDVIKNFTDPITGKFKADSQFEFFRAIGIRLSDKPAIRKAITVSGGNVGAAAQIFLKLKRIHNERNINKLYSLDEVFNEYPTDGKLEEIQSDNARYSALRELETKHADYASNYMVTNAEGNTQFEQSLHNTISIMMSTLNKVDSYAQLMAMPYMQHLNIDINPFAKASVWLNSLFDLDNYVAGDQNKTGKKRTKTNEPNSPKVEINMTNLSGVQLIDDNGDQGVASAKADEFTKLILDFHLSTVAGRPELMRHADKGTSFSVALSDIFNGSKDKKSYVDTLSFVERKIGDVSVITGYDSAIKILLPYVDAELKRINKMKELSKQKDLVYDANYLNEGQKFVIFEGVLSDKIQNELIPFESLGEAVLARPELLGEIKREIADYFESQFKDVKSLMGKAEFMSESLVSSTRIKANNAGYSANTAQTKDALTRSFVVNQWIHNIESMAVIYGDLAQYNMKKEEFHKRNAGAGSTGNLFASNTHMLNYVNNKGRLYARSKGMQEKALASTGAFDSAILADNEIGSAYYDKILKANRDQLAEQYKREKNPEKRKALEAGLEQKTLDKSKAYKADMTEGDGQGWITFDFYRALSMLEGKWSDKQEKMFKDIVAGVEIDAATALEFFPTRKFQYWGPVQTTPDQMPINAFHKFSLFPMIPSVIKGTNLEKLHDKMVSQGIDYATFKSGSKVGTLAKIKDGKAIQDTFYTDTDKRTFDADSIFTKNTIFLQFLKDQLEIAPYFKNQVTFPTQMRKLIENGMLEGGVPTDFQMQLSLNEREKAWKLLTPDQQLAQSPRYKMIKEYENDIAALTELRKQELIKEANIKFDPQGNIIFTEQLRNFLIKELNRQDLGEHEISFIKMGPGGKIAHDFSISLSAEKLEKILNSIVVRRLVKQKFNGEGLIQVSGAGFETTLTGELTPEQQAKYGTNGLAFYEQGADGKTSAMKVKIALQGDFLNLLYLNHKDGQPIETRERLNEMLKDDNWLDTDNHRKMVSIIGPRIPVQGLNSMEFAEVFEFLPIEAGNIVVLPSEIVAKSGGDFDIDKLTFLMPNIGSGVNYEYWTEVHGKARLKTLQERYPDLDLTEANVAKTIENRKAEDKTVEDKAILSLLAQNSVKNVKYATDRSAEGLENSILDKMRGILEMKENFVDLIRPNDTDIVMPISEDLEKDVMDVPHKTVTYKDKNGKEKSRIPGSKVFEIRYNLYKHASNNIGKQTLGLGAVDNTYNAVFNRIGLRMNHDYISRGGVNKRLEILLSHNTLKNKENQDVISLSHLLDAEGLNSISDVISQLMNGWVDIAKDAWIFNLQGNKEIAPSLLFMVQSGVPIKQAVYMVSNPLVRAYVNEQKMAKSTFAGPLGRSPGNPMYFRNQARKIIMTNPKYGMNMELDKLNSRSSVSDAYVYNYTMNLISKNDEKRPDGTQLDFFRADKVEQNLRDRIGKTDYTDADKAVFLHFIEIEEMSKAIRDVKLKTNFDTSRSNTLFEAQNKIQMLEDLRANGMLPEDIIEDVLNNSPIGSFYVQEFQISLWKDLFKLRNDKMLNQFIIDKMKDSAFMGQVEDTWGDTEKMVNQFRNDLVPFVFQNYLHDFDLDAMKAYKGSDTNTSYDVETLPSLKHGVYVKVKDAKRTFYVDKIQLKKDFINLSSKKGVIRNSMVLEDGTIVELAALNAAAFPNANNYYSFVFERELLRSMYPGKSGFTILQERGDVKAKLDEYTRDMPDKTKSQIETLVYEETLRDMALDNTFNTWKMFKSRESMADQLTQIQIMYPELTTTYGLVNNLSASISDRTGGNNRIANIMMTDMMLDADKVNAFHQNLKDLSNPAKIKLNTTNAQEKMRVAQFFEKLSTYAFLQSGLNTTGMFSLVRLVPQERFTSMMTPFISDFTSNMNPLTLERYWKQFLKISGGGQKRMRSRLRDYQLDKFSPQEDKRLAVGKTSAELKRLITKDIEPGRFAQDNSGNTLYYGNPSITQEGNPITGLTISSAAALVADNPKTAFVMNGTTDSIAGADKNESALIKAKATHGNVIPLPVKKTYGIAKDSKLTDVSAKDAKAIEGVDTMVAQENNKSWIDSFRYFGTYYDIKIVNGKAISVEEYKGKVDAMTKILIAYATNKNMDPQGNKIFRGPEMSQQKEEIKPIPSKYELKPGMMANEDQKKAIDKIQEFLESDKPYFLLEGGAGVGKTSSINKAIEDFWGPIVGAALSAEATSTLQVSMVGKKTMTIAKLIGLVAEKRGTEIIFRERNTFEEKKFRAANKVDPIEKAKLVIIDEASMIDTKTLGMLEKLKPKNTKIIYLGDRTQLPPIGEVVSKVFTKLEATPEYAKLDKPMRFAQGDPIFQITNDLFAKNIINKFEDKPTVYNPLAETSQEDMISDRESVLFRKKSTEISKSIVEQFKKARATNNLKEVVVIADTNAKVASLNLSIRAELYGAGAAQFVPGEIIVFKAPFMKDDRVAADNNTKAIVDSVKTENVQGIDCFILNITLFEVDEDGETVQSRERITVPKDKNQLRLVLSQMADLAKVRNNWGAFYKFKESFADIDYAYAMTVHKVQGSTYRTVYVDVDNVFRDGNPRTGLEINQMMRTATSRPTTNLILMSNDYKKSTADGIKDTVTPIENTSIPETVEEAQAIAVEGAPVTVEQPTANNPLPLINGNTINPSLKLQIDASIQSMKDYRDAGYELAFPATGFGQYMIGADDLTGELKENAVAIAPATFVYLSEQLYKNFKYINPNYQKVLGGTQQKDVTQEDVIVTDEEVRDALSFCFK